jgi:hypothetical protein
VRGGLYGVVAEVCAATGVAVRRPIAARPKINRAKENLLVSY